MALRFYVFIFNNQCLQGSKLIDDRNLSNPILKVNQFEKILWIVCTCYVSFAEYIFA